MTSDFCHLHVHSEYSLLDGLGRTKDLAKEAARLGQPALALTDHGVMHGAIEFFRNCKKSGVKPIIGVEAYMTPHGRSMTDRDPNKDKMRHHLLLLAQNMTGYKNLLKICSDAQLNGYYYKPRIDADYLAAHADGLICTTGCMAAEIPWLLNPEDGRVPQPEKAFERLQWYLDVFGRERFFIELQEHSIPALTKINSTLFEWAKKYKIEMVTTNDVHYVTAEDAKSHDTLLCVQTSALVTQRDRMRMSDDAYYLKSLDEMRETFRPLADLPDSAFTNTVKIAEMCEVDLEDKDFHLPDLPEQPVELMPKMYADNKDYPGFLRYLTEQGLQEKYGDEANSPRVQERLEHELKIINEMGFAIYFLLVWDLCRFAREQNIWWNVRGSGAGSIVAYAAGITLIDPLRHNLIFERFLNPGRISMPDFDLDYPDDQRELMIEYTRNRYGDKRVAQIVSFGRMKARAAVRDVGRAMDIPLSEVDVLAKHISAIPGKPATIDNSLDSEHEFFSPELKEKYDSIDYVKELIDSARNLEGVARHSSVHAAAVIITDQDLTEYVPVMRAQGSVITESVTQFEFPVCESIGLLKVDFLGLSTLTIMRKAAELIEQRHGLKFTLENLPMDNPEAFKELPHFPPPEKAFELLASGDVTGVFQVEGSGMRRVLTEMKPSKFEHIVAAISLFRPGPLEYIPTYIARMHGEEPVEFKHPRLESILGETYGIIVYQEQIIQIASQLAGYAPGDADRIRKAVGKKIKEQIEAHRSKFIDGSIENGIEREIAEAIYGDIEFFARYGFNKAHAADYALVTCQTAYLKAHYTIEYMAALLTVEQGTTDKIGMLLGECRAIGIEVLPPHVNFGGTEFGIEDRPDEPSKIRFGLNAVKNVGEGPVKAIVSAREEGGPFHDIDDFCNRVDLRQVGRRALECLIKVGAFDEFAPRHQLLAIMDRMVNLSSSMHKAADAGQMSMFDAGNFDAPQTGSVLHPLPDAPPISQKEVLEWEKELVGAYVSAHPIQKYMADIKAAGTILLGELDESKHEQQVTVAGLVRSIRHHQTRKGDPMAFIELEDIQTICEVIIFPRAYTLFKELLVENKLLVVRGKVDAKGNSAKILADNIATELTIVAGVAESNVEPEPVENKLPMFEGNGHSAPSEVVTNGVENGSGSKKTTNGHHAEVKQSQPVDLPVVKNLLSTPSLSATQKREQTTSQKLSAGLHITLPCTGNLDQDKHRLRQMYHLLTQNGGKHNFAIHIPTASRVVQIDFPNSSTHFTPDLERKLVTLFQAQVRWVE